MSESWDAYTNLISAEQLVPFSVIVAALTGTSFGPFPVTGFDGVELHVIPGSGPVTVQVSYSATPNGPGFGLFIWNLDAASTLDYLIPANGQFVTVTFTSLGAGSVTAQVYVGLSNDSKGRYVCLNPSPEVYAQNSTINAGGTKIHGLPCNYAGPAYAVYSPRDTAGQVQVYITMLTASGGSFRRIANFGTPAAEVSRMLILPGQNRVGFQLINNDAVSGHNYDLALIPAVNAY